MAESIVKDPSRPLPEINSVTRPFWEATKRHELQIQKCKGCGRYTYLPAILCPVCGDELEWTKVSGKGKVHTFIIMHQVYHPYYADKVPYNVTMVELEEGPIMMSNIVGVANEDIKVGMDVEVCFEDVDEEVTMPKFKPAGCCCSCSN